MTQNVAVFRIPATEGRYKTSVQHGGVLVTTPLPMTYFLSCAVIFDPSPRKDFLFPLPGTVSKGMVACFFALSLLHLQSAAIRGVAGARISEA